MVNNATLDQKRWKARQALQEDNKALVTHGLSFLKNAYPYYTVPDQGIESWLDASLVTILDSMHFFRLASCTTENVEDIAGFLQEKMTRLFIAIHSLNALVVYGLVSFGGKTDLVIGLADHGGKVIAKSVLEGLLTGIETSDYDMHLSQKSSTLRRGGIVTSVPVYKLDQAERFDISTLMRSCCAKIKL